MQKNTKERKKTQKNTNKMQTKNPQKILVFIKKYLFFLKKIL